MEILPELRRKGGERMSEYIIKAADWAIDYKGESLFKDCEEIVRCKDCKYAHSVFWPDRDNVPDDYLDCTGPLVTTWDYYNDEPQDNPVRPDGFCAWGEKKVDA